MPSYEHDRLVDRITHLDALPEDAAEYSAWINAERHLRFLRDNTGEDELAIYASGEYTFINTVVVNQDSISPIDQSDLLRWNGSPFYGCASYVWGGGRDDVWIERGGNHWDSKTLDQARPLVFGRELEGLKGRDRVYFEIQQEYSHVADIHWRQEQHAYCRFDEHGDWEQAVSITSKETKGGVTLVSFTRRQLDQYLAASNSVLVRMFDFMLLRYSEFTGWPDAPETVVRESYHLFYRQKVDPGKAAYTRGVQIIRPARPRNEIFASITNGWRGYKDRQYCEFTAWDRRNKRIASISTDPSATTSYFDASKNSLPFEVSPVFFRPEVLLRYKADRDKYTIDEEHRTIHCRGGWELRTYDINEAGQVHTYIRYLRALPYEEQLYWRSFNEKPKTDISERAFLNDYKGEPTNIVDPLANILSIVRRWAESDLTWWKLREEKLLERVNTPRTASRDEWTQAFSDLSKLVIEGFHVPGIRTRLKEMGIVFGKDEKSLTLIEKVLIERYGIVDGTRLSGLRTVQDIRSKVASHSEGSRAVELEREALEEHQTYSAHFENICNTVTSELNLIEEAFRDRAIPS